MNIFAATVGDHWSSTMSLASLNRARGVRAALAWDMKASCRCERFLDSSTLTTGGLHRHLNRQQRPWTSHLALSAVEAHRGGFDTAAMALAVNVVESAINQVMPSRSHDAWKLVDFPLEHAPFLYLRGFVALLPMTTLYESWKPGFGTRPQNLSRHVVAHGLTGLDERPEEPIIALMYAASILRGLQDWIELDLDGVAAQARRDAKAASRNAK